MPIPPRPSTFWSSTRARRIRYAGKQPITQIESEQNDLVYIPLGVGAVIPPWNFPLAIMAGMTTAAVVTGNTVVLKPSSDSPWIAYRFFELLEEAGMPPGVVNFVSGGGMEVGEPLVQHPRIRFISFTGSKGVGLHIDEEAAKHARGTALDQARRRGDGRQGRDHRRPRLDESR